MMTSTHDDITIKLGEVQGNINGLIRAFAEFTDSNRQAHDRLFSKIDDLERKMNAYTPLKQFDDHISDHKEDKRWENTKFIIASAVGAIVASISNVGGILSQLIPKGGAA